MAIKTRSMSIRTRSMSSSSSRALSPTKTKTKTKTTPKKPLRKITRKTSTSKQTNPTVVIPSLQNQPPKTSDPTPTQTLPPEPPSNQPSLNLPEASSSSLNPSSSTSQLPRLIPPIHPKAKKEIPPRKRLFEDVDTSSNDIFSFLDQKPSASNKPTKPTRRTVFKSSQPSFLKSNNRIPPETDSSKNKNRVLASSKLLAGSQPQAKRLKKTLPKLPASTPPNIDPVNTDPKQHPGIQTLSAIHPELQSTSNPPSHPPSKANVENYISTQKTQTLASVRDEPQPIIQDPSPSNFTPVIPVSSIPIPIDQSLKQAYEPTSIDPLLLALCPSTEPSPSLEQTVDQSTETSVDAIDFLNPKKKNHHHQQTLKNLEKPSRSVCPNLAQVEPTTQPSDQIIPSDSSVEPIQTLTNSSLEISSTESVNPRSDNISPELDSIPQPDPQDQSSISNTVSSLESQPASSADHPVPSNQASNDQVQASHPSSSLVDAALASAVEDTRASNEQTLPLNSSSVVMKDPVTPIKSSSTPEGAVSPPSNQVEGISTTPRSSPKLIPRRTSPIKHPTLPTSIPILKPMPSLAPQGLPPINQPSGSNQLVSNRPSMLPRRALKPNLASSQTLSLDAIIEASPEKRPVRDALSAASLNRSRGFGVPPRMIFTGGIKAKAESVFSRSMAGSSNSSFSYTSLGGITKPGGESSKPREQSNQMEDAKIPPKDDDHAEEGAVVEEEEEEESRSIDTSSTSITTQRSTASSNLSTRTNPQGENQHQQQFSENISIGTQDRLVKLQNMLKGMGRSESNDNSNSTTNLNNNSQRQQYTEYEVDLKNDDEENGDDSRNQQRMGESSYSMRSSRRRSSSVPLNYSENPSTSKAGSSRSQSVVAHTLITTTNTSSHKNQSKNGPVARRRVSNILPSARVDTSNPITSVDDPTASSDSSSPSASNGVLNNQSNTVNSRSRTAPLRNVVAFVDVRTAEGDDAGKVFVEMLKGLGAKVVGRPIFPLTHMIFKAGRQSTIERYMMHPRPKPHLVGIGWIVRCREMLSKAEEGPYKIDINSAQVPFNLEQNRPHHTNLINDAPAPVASASAHSRRKSMEPKALSLLNSAIQLSNNNNTSNSAIDSSLRHPLSRSCTNKSVTAPGTSNDSNDDASTITTTEEIVNRSNQVLLAQNIDKARRKSLQFLPKVGSPLASKVYTIT